MQFDKNNMAIIINETYNSAKLPIYIGLATSGTDGIIRTEFFDKNKIHKLYTLDCCKFASSFDFTNPSKYNLLYFEFTLHTEKKLWFKKPKRIGAYNNYVEFQEATKDKQILKSTNYDIFSILCT